MFVVLAVLGPVFLAEAITEIHKQLVDEVIRPALQIGKTVISDRFLLANVAYQGNAGDVPVDAVWEVG